MVSTKTTKPKTTTRATKPVKKPSSAPAADKNTNEKDIKLTRNTIKLNLLDINIPLIRNPTPKKLPRK